MYEKIPYMYNWCPEFFKKRENRAEATFEVIITKLSKKI